VGPLVFPPYYSGLRGCRSQRGQCPRSGPIWLDDWIAIASYLGQGDLFDRAVAEFSAAYADQNERDYQAFTEAVNSGRLIAQTGV
jgi:Uncharacterized protein conserved in bacteria (DUF2252)